MYKIQQWVYSWMRPGYVEDKDEYKISKNRLLQFVCLAPVFRAADNSMTIILSMIRFLQGHIFVHRDVYLHFPCRSVRHFDCSHGSLHEVKSKELCGDVHYFITLLIIVWIKFLLQGTKFGKKRHSASMQPTMSLDTSAHTHSLQAAINAAYLDSILHMGFTQKREEMVWQTNISSYDFIWWRTPQSGIWAH